MSHHFAHSAPEKTKIVTAIVIGAGCRGSGYASYALCDRHPFKVIGVAEPRDDFRNKFVDKYKIPTENIFKDWKDAAQKEKIADCVIVCTQDKLHKDPAVAFAKLKYHILLEKPMAPTEEECREIVKTCKSEGVLLQVCHVLRYSPWAMKIKEIIDSGRIGDVVNIQHLEPVGHWHFAHSYVRGNWHKESDSSSSLLAKCCHDLDLINYWMGSKNRCEKISSFGKLSHFSKDNKPKGAASRCLDCPSAIERVCPYSAKKVYLEKIAYGHKGWPLSILHSSPDIENITEQLKTGPYGKCVYDCDNDVMSNQVVNMQFKNGATANMTMIAFTEATCDRKVTVFGTKGELQCHGAGHSLVLYDFTRGDHDRIDTTAKMMKGLSGHGGADFYCMDSFVEAVVQNDPEKIRTGPDETLYSHMLVFAAEKARKENKVVSMSQDGTFT
ncbi:putative oxidoreductase YteT isoform X1 [Mytilus trossulus]|uniref:putative oxidoreductase YteT isoform X1 n=1 Tax=Mytilus trossulus TaxID=6551 RepID=UPI0030055F11